MGSIFIPAYFAFLIIGGSHQAHFRHFDAPVPEVCQSFEGTMANKTFCHDWKAAHERDAWTAAHGRDPS